MPSDTQNDAGRESPRPPMNILLHLIAGIDDAIDDERLRLHKAMAILECLIYSMAYRDEATDEELRGMDSAAFASVAETARDLIEQSVSKLDAVTAQRCGAFRRLLVPASGQNPDAESPPSASGRRAAREGAREEQEEPE